MRILAVEDQPEYLEMLQEVMTAVGHTLVIARDGREGLKILDEEEIDVIISDVAMPTMGGIEFHEAVRRRREHANTPFIFLTGVTNLAKVKQACSTEADLLLQKPFPIDKLLEMFSGRLT